MLCRSWGPFHIVKFALECILGGFFRSFFCSKDKSGNVLQMYNLSMITDQHMIIKFRKYAGYFASSSFYCRQTSPLTFSLNPLWP